MLQGGFWAFNGAMKRLKFTVAYDGAGFSGWQCQPSGVTVQDVIEQALVVRLGGDAVRIHAAGRTDAGVHALGQVFHVDVAEEVGIPTDRWAAALNSTLPASIRVLEVSEVSADFHARYSAVSKTYCYTIARGMVQLPHDAGRVWHLPKAWSVELMAAAVECLAGRHDFSHFCALRGNEPDPLPPDYFVRTIFESRLTQSDEDHVQVWLTGDGFLYKMVRCLVGAAYSVARGKWTLAELQVHLSTPQALPKDPPPVAPPDGLCLMNVRYEAASRQM